MLRGQPREHEGVGPIALAEPVLDVVRFEPHPDATRERGGGLVAGVHLGGDAVEPVMLEPEREGCLDCFAGEPTSAVGRVEDPSDLCLPMFAIRQPERHIADGLALVLDDEREGAAVGLETGPEEPFAELVVGVFRVNQQVTGSDPFIVMPSADLEQAVETAVTARIQNNGQSCIAAKRFIIHTDIYDAFAEKFVAALRGLTVGDPLDQSTDVGPVATEGGRQDLVDLVEDARQKGASILLGGDVPEGRGWFYPVTAIADLPDQARLVREEAFGPLAALYKVADREEAVQVANRTDFGLSSSVWTQDPEEQEFFLERIEAGGVFVNGMTASAPELPFGGVKHSGYGRELSAAGIRAFCNLKTVWVA